MSCRCVRYAAAAILTIGFSQVIGATGLICTAIKTIYDRVQLARYQSKQDSVQVDSHFYAKYRNKVRYYDKRCKDNLLYTKAFGLCLISLVLNHALGYLKPSLDLCISDIAVGLLGPRFLRSNIFYPLSGVTISSLNKSIQKWNENDKKRNKNLHVPKLNYHEKREDFITKHGGKAVSIMTQEADFKKRRALDAIWMSQPQTSPTVILFHGNGMTLDDNFDVAGFYHGIGFNVLNFTLGGYPGSSPEKEITEISNYYDAQAVVDFVKKEKTVDLSKILVHGLSLGGALAIHAAADNPGFHVVIDQTFSSIADVAQNFCNNVPLLKMLQLNATCRDVASAAFPLNETDGRYTTNGLNNIEKIKKVSGRLFVIQTTSDHLMATEKGNLSDQLVDAYNYSHTNEARKVSIEGGHCHPFVLNGDAVWKLQEFLVEIGLVKEIKKANPSGA